MRAVIFIFASIFAFATQAKSEAPTPFIYPPLEQSKALKSSPLKRPGYCEVEIANLSHKTAFVDIVYDTFQISAGHRVDPGYSLYIPLNYDGGCHRAAYTLIYSPEAQILYKDYGYTDQVLKIYSSFNSEVAVKQVKKK